MSIVTGTLVSLLINAATRPTETERRYPMGVAEIVGYSREDLATALEVMESSINMGEKVRLTICTEALPTEEELAYMFLGMVEAGCHISRPSAQIIQGIPTTKFLLQKGSPQWQVIIPILVPLFIIGLIAFGIAKIEEISKALLPLLITSAVGLVALALIVRRPAEKYLERGGKYLPETKKSPAAR